MKTAKILLVDDDPLILKSVCRDLEIRGFDVATAGSGTSAVDLLARISFDLVITDLIMDDIDGIGVLKAAKERDPQTMVMVLTGHGDMASAIDALRHEADDYVLKPCDSDEMFFRAHACLRKRDLARKVTLYESMLPVCCVCKKIRDDTNVEPGAGEWIDVEAYLHRRAGVDVTSSYCPECAARAREDLEKLKREKT